MNYIVFMGEVAITMVCLILFFISAKLLDKWIREAKYKNDVKQCLSEINEYIDRYRTRFDGENRFLFNVELMMKMFPEYSMEVCKEVFDKLVAQEKVTRNKIDDEWQLQNPREAIYKEHGEQIPKRDTDIGLSW